MSGALRMHASAVSVQSRGVLIVGASGSGKSSLALHLMAFGATLISDDQTVLKLQNGRVWASAPEAISGKIEARGVGLLQAEFMPAVIELVVDLDSEETSRLPACHRYELLGVHLPCLYKVQSSAWPFAILQYLRGGRSDL